MNEDDLWDELEDIENDATREAWGRARGVDADVILAAAAAGDSDAQLIRAQAQKAKRFIERTAELHGETVEEAWKRITGPSSGA